MEVAVPGPTPADEIVAAAPVMAAAVHRLLKAAEQRRPTFVYGESGVGTGWLCGWAHQRGRAEREPFVLVACQTLPPELHEPTLFGAGGRPGAIERAAGGTLVLRCFEDLDLQLQRRVLARRADHWLVATTYSSPRIVLTESVLLAFEDVIEVPALRTRREDIGDLARLFWRRLADANGWDPPPLELSDIERLREHSWPGNVRQLWNTLLVLQVRWQCGEAIDQVLPTLLGPAPLMWRDPLDDR